MDDRDLLTIPEVLRHWSQESPDVPVFTFYDASGLVTALTTGDVYNLSGTAAALLRRWDFKPGDVIANGLPNSPERVIWDFGIIMAGCVLTNCQVIERDGTDFWHCAKCCRCSAVILSPKLDTDPNSQLFSPFIASTTSTTHTIVQPVTIPQVPSLSRLIICRRTRPDPKDSIKDYFKLVQIQDVYEANCKPTDTAVIFGTSGSVGFSKLVANSHEKILADARISRGSPGASHFSDRPFGWMGGFPHEFLGRAARRVLQDKFNNKNTESPCGIWDTIALAQCEGAALLPNQILEMVDYFQNRPPSYKLNHIGTGSQPLGKDLMKALGLLCKVLVVCYGSTECRMIALDVITNPDNFREFCCGKVRDSLQIKIVDEHQEEREKGEQGEIYLKCNSFLKQHSGKKNQFTTDLSENFTLDGWFPTGDWGMVSPDDDRLFCYGRKGDVVTLGCVQIYLAWPETILSKCPLIKTCSVVEVEAPSQQNVTLCACVVPNTGGRGKLTEKAVKSFFDDQLINMALKHRLTISYVIFLDKLPTLPSGKISKRDLKRFVLDRYNTMSTTR